MGNNLSYVMLGIGLSGAMIWSSEVTAQETPRPRQAEEIRPFQWPDGKHAAVSLSFDDARTSQIDTGLAVLGEHRVKVTFFVQAENIGRRLGGWKKAAPTPRSADPGSRRGSGSAEWRGRCEQV